MRLVFFVSGLAFLLASCGVLPRSQTVVSDLPILGVVGKEQQSLSGLTFRMSGQPKLNAPVGLALEARPFTKTKYKRYTDHLASRGEAPSWKFSDSLAQRKMYYTLTIVDAVAYTAQMNLPENDDLLQYAAYDKAIEVLREIRFTAPEALGDVLRNADEIELKTQKGRLVISLKNQDSPSVLDISNLEPFGFETSSFCWSKTPMGKKQIAVLSEGDSKCPDGTQVTSGELYDSKSYLKY